MARKENNFFWITYSDLMTSMFFIMLVLFVLTVVMLKREQLRIIARLEEYQKIEEIKRFLNAIDSDYFEYRQDLKKHVFKLMVEYPKGEFEIQSITNKQLLPEIEKAGIIIKNTIAQFSIEDNIQILVILEGQSSFDNYWINECLNNDVLSYQRALKLKEFWELKGIFLDQIPNCELIIAGSGQGGIPREQPDWGNTRNQRFLIHIIPKTGEILPTL